MAELLRTTALISGRSDLIIVPNTAVEILSASQPLRLITFVFSYANADLTGLKPDRFLAVRYDEPTAQWVTLFSQIDPGARTVTSEVKHFSLLANAYFVSWAPRILSLKNA